MKRPVERWPCPAVGFTSKSVVAKKPASTTSPMMPPISILSPIP